MNTEANTEANSKSNWLFPKQILAKLWELKQWATRNNYSWEYKTLYADKQVC